jgi:hypothetical protein
MHCRPHLLLTSLLVIVATLPAHAGFLGFGKPVDTDVNVVVDMTDEGKKVAPPTKEKPAFYFPVVAGYREEGAIVAGEKKPPANPVAHLLAH